jgi:TnpA family transposase
MTIAVVENFEARIVVLNKLQLHQIFRSLNRQKKKNNLNSFCDRLTNASRPMFVINFLDFPPARRKLF